MKRIFLFAFTILSLIAGKTSAQFNYDFAVLRQPYTPLTGGTVITNDTNWNDIGFKISLGFTFNLNGISVNDFNVISGNAVASDTDGVLTGLMIADYDLRDRRTATDTSNRTTLRYRVDGAAGSRIFKFELANAGFLEEYDNYGTTSDSVYYQVWYFEGTNVMELHYGPSSISYMADYFPLGKVLTGFANDVDINTGSISTGYFLSGSPSNPTLDTFYSLNSALMQSGLDSLPSEGIVYRFTPKPTEVNKVSNAFSNVFVSTICTDAIAIRNNREDMLKYNVVGIDGTVLKNGVLLRGLNNIDISNLPAGMYIVNLTHASAQQAVRIIKM